MGLERVLDNLEVTQEFTLHNRLHSRGTPRVPPQLKKSSSFPSSYWDEGLFPWLVGKGIPAFLSHLKRRRSQLETQEEFQWLCHNSKRPRCPNPLQIYLIPLHRLDLHPEIWLKTRWHVWQPCGPSRDSHRFLCQLDRKLDTTVTAREERGLACLHRRPGLTPLWKLPKNREIHVSTGEEHLCYGLKYRWGPRTRHRLERCPDRPRGIGMESGLSLGNTSGSLRSPS